jgi:hypothetical protein
MKYAANRPVSSSGTTTVGIVDPSGGAAAGLVGPAAHRELQATDETLIGEVKALREVVAGMSELLIDKLSE